LTSDGDITHDPEAELAMQQHQLTYQLEDHYKTSINLFIGRQRCDLGTFATLNAAMEAYDRYAIGRRTLALKLQCDFQLKRKVETRKAAYIASESALKSEEWFDCR